MMGNREWLRKGEKSPIFRKAIPLGGWGGWVETPQEEKTVQAKGLSSEEGRAKALQNQRQCPRGTVPAV